MCRLVVAAVAGLFVVLWQAALEACLFAAGTWTVGVCLAGRVQGAAIRASLACAPPSHPTHPQTCPAARKDSLLPAAKKRPNLSAADAVQMQQDAASSSGGGASGSKGR